MPLYSITGHVNKTTSNGDVALTAVSTV